MGHIKNLRCTLSVQHLTIYNSQNWFPRHVNGETTPRYNAMKTHFPSQCSVQAFGILNSKVQLEMEVKIQLFSRMKLE